MNPENGGTPPAGSASNAPAAAQPIAPPVTGSALAANAASNPPNGQPTAPATLEEALALLAQRDRDISEVRREAAGYRTKAKELDTIKQQQAQANLTEVEREKQAREAAEKKTAELTARYRQAAIEATAKTLGIVDPALAATLIAASDDLKLDGDGMPTNAEQVLRGLIKDKPYLAPAQTTGPANAPAGGNPALPTFLESQLADFDFYTKNEKAILQAMRDGRIVRGK